VSDTNPEHAGHYRVPGLVMGPDPLRQHLFSPSGTDSNSPQSGTGIECFRINKKIIIPTGPLRRKLGMEAA
jgi:hypothetical protein